MKTINRTITFAFALLLAVGCTNTENFEKVNFEQAFVNEHVESNYLINVLETKLDKGNNKNIVYLLDSENEYLHLSKNELLKSYDPSDKIDAQLISLILLDHHFDPQTDNQTEIGQIKEHISQLIQFQNQELKVLSKYIGLYFDHEKQDFANYLSLTCQEIISSPHDESRIDYAEHLISTINH